MTTLSLRRHYKSCGRSHRKKRLKKKPWGDLGKQNQMVRNGRWHVGADCSKYGQQQQGRPDHWRRAAVYDGHFATVRKQIEVVSRSWNRPCTRAHRRDTTVLSYADTKSCTQDLYTRTASLNWIISVLSATAVGGGAEWCGHSSTKRTRVARPSSWPTGAAGKGTTECQPGLRCSSPVVTGQVAASK